jgi:Tfp pilus assembly protein PilN
MINLLPDNQKKLLKQTYRMRRLVVWGSLLAGVTALAILLQVSIYFLLTIRQSALKSQLESAATTQEGKRLAEIQAEARAVASELKVVRANKPSTISTVAERLLAVAPAGVKIDLFSYEAEGKSGTIGGIASGRRELVSYVEALEQVEGVVKVEAPLSAVIGDANSSFTINFTLK